MAADLLGSRRSTAKVVAGCAAGWEARTGGEGRSGAVGLPLCVVRSNQRGEFYCSRPAVGQREFRGSVQCATASAPLATAGASWTPSCPSCFVAPILQSK